MLAWGDRAAAAAADCCHRKQRVPILSSLGITTCDLENPAPCQTCEKVACTLQSVLFMAQLKCLAGKIPASGATL